MMSCGAVENNQVLVSLAQIVFRFDPFRLSGIAVVIHSFNSDSRVYKVVFLQERPDRIVERLVFIKVNDHSNHISNRVEGAARDRGKIGPRMPCDGKTREMPRSQIVDHGHQGEHGQRRKHHIETDGPAAQSGKAWIGFSCHDFQRRLSITRKVRKSKKKVELPKKTSARVSMTPRAKSCICSIRST